MMNNFVKLPNKTVWSNEGNLIKQFQNPLLPSVLISLEGFVNNRGNCVFTLEDLIIDCGFKLSKKKGETNDKFKSLLTDLQVQGIIEYDRNFLEIKPKDHVNCKYHGFDTDDEFFSITYEDYDEIKGNANDVNIFCYLNSRFNHGQEHLFCYPSVRTISEDLGIQIKTVEASLKRLSDKEMIFYDKVGYLKDDKKECVNVYSTTLEGLSIGLRSSKEYYAKKYGEENIVFNKNLCISR